jgi:hypothetical protein
MFGHVEYSGIWSMERGAVVELRYAALDFPVAILCDTVVTKKLGNF